ncbi:hypothetical protein EHH60_15160 [Bradyrhizobium sp. RP6]|nr:hypothetical protein EHH60_15160 [Bradyrhizobium sp. RP6]
MRAQRSNPDCLPGKTLDCFAALAMTVVAGYRPTKSTPPQQRPARGTPPPAQRDPASPRRAR